jgi:preprotein translocase subunit Sss1
MKHVQKFELGHVLDLLKFQNKPVELSFIYFTYLVGIGVLVIGETGYIS